jgi:large subunit ribosomal protein L22
MTKTAVASAKMLRVSPRKLGLVADLIRGLPVERAIVQLSFCKRRIAGAVCACLKSAVANAENNNGLDIDDLIVSSVSVGKAAVMKRVSPRARGRSARVMKFLSNLYIEVSQVRG